jgi:hypothetical protein
MLVGQAVGTLMGYYHQRGAVLQDPLAAVPEAGLVCGCRRRALQCAAAGGVRSSARRSPSVSSSVASSANRGGGRKSYKSCINALLYARSSRRGRRQPPARAAAGAGVGTALVGIVGGTVRLTSRSQCAPRRTRRGERLRVRAELSGGIGNCAELFVCVQLAPARRDTVHEAQHPGRVRLPVSGAAALCRNRCRSSTRMSNRGVVCRNTVWRS